MTQNLRRLESLLRVIQLSIFIFLSSVFAPSAFAQSKPDIIIDLDPVRSAATYEARVTSIEGYFQTHNVYIRFHLEPGQPMFKLIDMPENWRGGTSIAYLVQEAPGKVATGTNVVIKIPDNFGRISENVKSFKNAQSALEQWFRLATNISKLTGAPLGSIKILKGTPGKYMVTTYLDGGTMDNFFRTYDPTNPVHQARALKTREFFKTFARLNYVSDFTGKNVGYYAATNDVAVLDVGRIDSPELRRTYAEFAGDQTLIEQLAVGFRVEGTPYDRLRADVLENYGNPHTADLVVSIAKEIREVVRPKIFGGVGVKLNNACVVKKATPQRVSSYRREGPDGKTEISGSRLNIKLGYLSIFLDAMDIAVHSSQYLHMFQTFKGYDCADATKKKGQVACERGPEWMWQPATALCTWVENVIPIERWVDGKKLNTCAVTWYGYGMSLESTTARAAWARGMARRERFWHPVVIGQSLNAAGAYALLKTEFGVDPFDDLGPVLSPEDGLKPDPERFRYSYD